MEAIFLDCGAGGPQLKRNPLGIIRPMPSYDRADWHYGADNFPRTQPPENGATHIGFFLTWAILNGLESELHQTESQEALDAVRARTMTGRQFLLQECDEKLTDNDLNEEGNSFAASYYSTYLQDYDRTFARRARGIYNVEDNWENYDLIAPTIAEAFTAWKRPKPRPWWRFWGE